MMIVKKLRAFEYFQHQRFIRLVFIFHKRYSWCSFFSILDFIDEQFVQSVSESLLTHINFGTFIIYFYFKKFDQW